MMVEYLFKLCNLVLSSNIKIVIHKTTPNQHDYIFQENWGFAIAEENMVPDIYFISAKMNTKEMKNIGWLVWIQD